MSKSYRKKPIRDTEGKAHASINFTAVHLCSSSGKGGESIYLIFFLGRSWFEWPHLRLRQLVARGGRRAYESYRQHYTLEKERFGRVACVAVL
jgi:hypothetical protein